MTFPLRTGPPWDPTELKGKLVAYIDLFSEEICTVSVNGYTSDRIEIAGNQDLVKQNLCALVDRWYFDMELLGGAIDSPTNHGGGLTDQAESC